MANQAENRTGYPAGRRRETNEVSLVLDSILHFGDLLFLDYLVTRKVLTWFVLLQNIATQKTLAAVTKKLLKKRANSVQNSKHFLQIHYCTQYNSDKPDLSILISRYLLNKYLKKS